MGGSSAAHPRDWSVVQIAFGTVVIPSLVGWRGLAWVIAADATTARASADSRHPGHGRPVVHAAGSSGRVCLSLAACHRTDRRRPYVLFRES